MRMRHADTERELARSSALDGPLQGAAGEQQTQLTHKHQRAEESEK